MHSSHLQVRWVYISNNGNGAISVCSVDASTGALSACTNTSSLFGGRGGVEFNATGKLAYFPSFNTEIVYQCNVNSSTGLLSGCVNSGGATFANPSGLASHSGGLPGFGSNWFIMPDYGIGVILPDFRTF